MKKILIIAALTLFTMAVYAQQTKKLTADKHNEYGLVYTLPKTQINIDVTARHIVRQAGPYWQYAKRYFGTEDVIREDEELWEITDVKVWISGVADPEQRYLMQLKPGVLTSIYVDDDGMLQSINAMPPKQVPPVLYRPASAPQMPNLKQYLDYVNEDFLSSQSSAKQAQLLSETMMEVRDSRLSLSRGTAETMPTDGRQLELMLEQLSAQEEAIARAFKGVEIEETVSRRFSYVPEEEGTVTVFRMSDFAGFVDKDDLSGWEVKATLKEISPAILPKDEKGNEKQIPKDAVIYAIPAGVSLNISCKNDTLLEEELQIAQFGTVFGLAPALFTDKKSPSYATFNPATGALIEISEVTKE
ncbi:MAG: DUF4831 family protein [Prevotella sp.]|nr:DUF4831 family protein [Bacteroides sp.]MCM1365707.1 DUF4831 family protein [Prevotella sp.]MCM1436377.1 DUF4831 family protein [Prevotella sp.]